jgi:multidrug efflux pump subunit AcrA (membrane-fusion protein)
MKKGPLFKSIRVLIVLVTAMVLAVLLITFRPEAERQVPTVSGRLVEVIPAKSETLSMFVEAFGTIRPKDALSLVAEVRGQIVAIDPSFEEGNFINKGTTLIQIDPRNYQLEVDHRKVQIQQAEAEIKRLYQEVRNLKARIKIAKTDVTLAEKEYLRLKQLIGKNVISQSTLDKAQQQYLASQERLQSLENQLALMGPMQEQSIAQKDMAKVSLEAGLLDLERTGIVAPFDAWALDKFVEVGQHVAAGQVLGKIYSAGSLEIEISIPVKEFKWLPADMGQNTFVKAEIIFEGGGRSLAWEGYVVRTKAQMDEKTRTLPLVIEVSEDSAVDEKRSTLRLRPGMFVRVKITGNTIDRAYVLPRYLVYPDDVVYLFEADRLKIKPVSVLRTYKESVIITEGLAEGDLIIKTPLSSATEGMPVRIKPQE